MGERGGAYAGNDAARTVGTIASLIMPSESLWQLAAYHLQPPIVRSIGVGPFAYAVVPTPAMVWWAAGYAVVILVLGLRQFGRRAL